MLLSYFVPEARIKLLIRRPARRVAGIPITLPRPAPGLLDLQILNVSIDEQIIGCPIVTVPCNLAFGLVERAPRFRMDVVILCPGRRRLAYINAIHRLFYINYVVIPAPIV